MAEKNRMQINEKKDFMSSGRGGAISILAHGYGWMAVDKPAGMSIHNEPGSDLVSMAAVRMERSPSALSGMRPEPGFGIAAVHRLDRDTSGVVLMACRPEISRHFSGQFESRTVKKRYIAVLHGRLGATGEKGWWNDRLSRNAAGRNDPAGRGKKTDCRTAWEVLEANQRYTMVAVEPVTGRKHQIRRHAKLAGHPVAGDRRYGSKRSIRYLSEQSGFDRLALHAASLTFVPFEKDEPETVVAPMPPEFRELFSSGI